MERDWTDADFARAADVTAGGASKVVYGDVEPGRKISTFCEKVLGVPAELWDDKHCPLKLRPHAPAAMRRTLAPFVEQLTVRARGRPAA